jgi:porphobilinogen synthase
MFDLPSLPLRLQRLRKNKTTRAMLQEIELSKKMFIAPLFISETISSPTAIQSMPGCYQLPLNALESEIDALSKLGIQAVLLFGIPAYKDAEGSASLSENGIIQQATRLIKKHNPDMLVITDLCFCEYTSHGHCGALDDKTGNTIDNDKTRRLLGQQALSHAEAGADWIAPSAMADGMVGAIRTSLDNGGFVDTAILSYSVKYASSLYGPFREAALGAPQFGDRKSYQMNPANGLEALREVALDLAEGADLIMVKPAGNYLDVIYKIKQQYPEVPLCAYQVSGEYAMLKAAAKAGLVDEEAAMIESLLAIKRAGSDLIISYFAKDIARYLG